MTIKLLRPYIIFSGKIVKPGTVITVTHDLGTKLIKDMIAEELKVISLEYFVKDLKGLMPEKLIKQHKDEEE